MFNGTLHNRFFSKLVEIELAGRTKDVLVVTDSRDVAKEILEKLVWETSCVKIGEMYGVSDNAVNKWCKFYEIKKPGRGDWEKIKYGKLDKPEL